MTELSLKSLLKNQSYVSVEQRNPDYRFRRPRASAGGLQRSVDFHHEELHRSTRN